MNSSSDNFRDYEYITYDAGLWLKFRNTDLRSGTRRPGGIGGKTEFVAGLFRGSPAQLSTFPASPVTLVFLSASMTSMLMMIAMLIWLYR